MNKELVKLVKIEAKNLKKFATKDELDNLHFKSLNPNDSYSCIYGQMTGNCLNRRAEELTLLANKKGFPGQLSDAANEKPVNIGTSNYRHWSPIEVFIQIESNKKVNNEILINFLQGKTKVLNFKK